jgi:hypothetical protein
MKLGQAVQVYREYHRTYEESARIIFPSGGEERNVDLPIGL